MEEGIIHELIGILPQIGKVRWIGLRPIKKAEPLAVETVNAGTENGLEGDHYAGTSGNRQVTLIQAEHLEAVAGMLAKEKIDPGMTRRNIVVSGINLLALKDKQFYIGNTLLQGTGLCHPCSRMEENLGAGGYNAMRGHGGITARVVQAGQIKLLDEVRIL